MANTSRKVSAKDVREYVEKRYIEHSRKKGEKRFKVNAGEVHRALGLQNRVPSVCMALQSKKFLDRYGLRLVEKTGPASGMSTTVTLTFEIAEEAASSSSQENPLFALRGIARDLFASLGGGEQFLRGERQAFSSSAKRRER